MQKKTLYSYSTSFSFFIIHILLLLFYLLLYYTLFLYTHIRNQIQTKTNYLWSLIPLPHICSPKLFQPLIILHMLVFSPCLSPRPKIQNASAIFNYKLS